MNLRLDTLPDLVKKYDRPGPRYTSYPTAPQWSSGFGPQDYREALLRGAARPDERFALYVHVPFWEERCHYCGCNVVISKKPDIVDAFLEHVALEPKLQQLRAENKARRWWLPQVGEKFGGLGLSVVDHGLLRAKLDKSPLGFYSFTCQATDAGNIEILIERGNDLQKNAYLQRLLDGEIRSCFSMPESEHAGSNPVHMSTREDAAQFEKLCAFSTEIR